MLEGGVDMRQPQGGNMMFEGNMTAGGFIILIVLILGIITFGLVVIRALSARKPDELTAREELEAEYARGDITEAEYEKRKLAL
jgi:putative membrane protein